MLSQWGISPRISPEVVQILGDHVRDCLNGFTFPTLQVEKCALYFVCFQLPLFNCSTTFAHVQPASFFQKSKSAQVRNTLCREGKWVHRESDPVVLVLHVIFGAKLHSKLFSGASEGIRLTKMFGRKFGISSPYAISGSLLVI